MTQHTLRTRIAFSLFLYSLLLAAAVLTLGYVTNEDVEKVIWNALLEPEMDRQLARDGRGPQRQMPDAERLHNYSVPDTAAGIASLPEDLRALPEGFHDEIFVGGREVAVLVRMTAGWRDFVVVDITDLEQNERSLAGLLFGVAALITAILVAAVWWLSGRLLRPVSKLAADVDALDPALRGVRLPTDSARQDEVDTIGRAINRLLDRIEGFVARERTFINTVSHELRTPIAVIAGAADLANTQADLPEPLRRPLQRIRRATREIDQLIGTLLVLAKSPDRLRENASTFRLDELVRDVVADHQPLTLEKSLVLVTDTLEETVVFAPERIAQVAIANLVRNAIEHSDLGTVTVSVAAHGVVRIDDPGHGMAAEDVGRLYTARARRGEAAGARGIGLELIARICEHLGWTLELRPRDGTGTSAILDLHTALAPGRALDAD